MKKITLLIIALLLSASSFAQYESFFGQNSTSYSQFFSYLWYSKSQSIPKSNNYVVGFGFTFDSYFTKDDTVRINDKLYYKTSYIPNANTGAPSTFEDLDMNQAEFDYYLREDVTSGKLYFYCEGTNTELLWCDMSLEAGDTFTLPLSSFFSYGFDFFYAGYNINYSEIVVDSVNYIDGKKIIYFPSIIATYMENTSEKQLLLKFVEGVGPLFGPAVESGFIGRLAHHTILLCLHKDDTLTFMTNPAIGCEQMGGAPLGIDEHNKQKLELSLNSSNTELRIELPEDIENSNGVLRILDISGRTLYSNMVNSNTQTINISSFKSGVYVVDFRNARYNLSGKFVKGF